MMASRIHSLVDRCIDGFMIRFPRCSIGWYINNVVRRVFSLRIFNKLIDTSDRVCFDVAAAVAAAAAAAAIVTLKAPQWS